MLDRSFGCVALWLVGLLKSFIRIPGRTVSVTHSMTKTEMN